MEQEAGGGKRTQRVAGWVAFAVAVIVVVQGVFILIIGVDQSERTLAITVIAVGLQSSFLFWFAFLKRVRVPPAVLWVLPAMLFGWSVHFLVNDDLGIAVPNFVFALMAALGIVAAQRIEGRSRARP